MSFWWVKFRTVSLSCAKSRAVLHFSPNACVIGLAALVSANQLGAVTLNSQAMSQSGMTASNAAALEKTVRNSGQGLKG